MESLDRQQSKWPTELEMEVLFRNLDQKNLVAPLRELRAARSKATPCADASEEKRRAALALQEQWEAWLVRRELLRNELKRGRELLEKSELELSRLRAQLEEWPAYERVCGKNPLLEYMHSIAGHESVRDFLPPWLKRREAELAAVTRSLEECARQNGLEHLL